MNRLGLVLATATLAISCVSAPDVTTASGTMLKDTSTIIKITRKERTEEYKTPFVVKETVTFADGVVDRVISYTYSDGYARLLSTAAVKPSMAEPSERVAYEYREGTLVSKSTFGADGTLLSKIEYAYGSDGTLAKESISDGKGMIQTVSDWIWDNGRKTSWRVLSSAGLVLAKTEYFYEGDALAITKLFDGAGNQTGRVEYVYQGDNLAGTKYFTAAGAPDGRVEYETKNGLVSLESVYKADGRLERRLAYEYGPDGTLSKKTISDSSGKEREYVQYAYAYRNDTRVIVYYE